MKKFGKLAVKHDERTLMMSYYATALDPPPLSVDLLSRVYSNLKINDPTKLFPMDGNDVYGDCTVAGLAHLDTVYNGLAGKKKILSKSKVLKLYKILTGGPDTGLVELDVLNYWRKNNINGNKILAYVKVDHKNHTHVKQAIQLFGGLYLGINIQQDAISDFENGHKIWTPGPLTEDGHAIVATSYDQETITVITWGDVQKGTWAWWDECVDECYAIIPAEISGFEPAFNFNQLYADLQAITN
jgi:hypothetical protein